MGGVVMKSAMGLTGSGSRDWILQRISAIILAVYTVVILAWLLCNKGFEYVQWQQFMGSTAMGVFSLLTVVSLAIHAWVGMWTVFTDYVTTRQMGATAPGLRIVLQGAAIVSIIVFTLWGIQIFW
jgi:succinate dehydrogenase / fumarate reductase membrane anchor subunit